MASLDDAIQLFNGKEYGKSIPIFEYWLSREYEEAAVFLGAIHQNGLSVKIDTDRALEYFLIGAKLGSMRSMYHAGVIYANKKNYDYAIRLLTEAAENDFVLAQAVLGFFYREGPHNFRDRKKAKYYLMQASKNRHIEARGAYGNILLHQGTFFEKLLVPILIVSVPIIMIRFAILKDDDDIFEVSSGIIKY